MTCIYLEAHKRWLKREYRRAYSGVDTWALEFLDNIGSRYMPSFEDWTWIEAEAEKRQYLAGEWDPDLDDDDGEYEISFYDMWSGLYEMQRKLHEEFLMASDPDPFANRKRKEAWSK